MNKTLKKNLLAAALVVTGILTNAHAARQTINLNGVWQIAEGTMAEQPASFPATCPVPGYADFATPPFKDVGVVGNKWHVGMQREKDADGKPMTYAHREAFWYRREFKLDGPVPAVAVLKLNKVKWGSKIWLNGQLVSEHLPNFTPYHADLAKLLKGNGEPNELVVRVGAAPNVNDPKIPISDKIEKSKYFPGIWDDVELILADSYFVRSAQIAPMLKEKKARVVAQIDFPADAKDAPVKVIVCEAASGKEVASGSFRAVPKKGEREWSLDVKLDLPSFTPWTPEKPFLYTATIKTPGDTWSSRFGMPSFRVNNDTFELLRTFF